MLGYVKVQIKEFFRHPVWFPPKYEQPRCNKTIKVYDRQNDRSEQIHKYIYIYVYLLAKLLDITSKKICQYSSNGISKFKTQRTETEISKQR